MHDPERQALSRATILLLVVSLGRWAATARAPEPAAPPAAADVLADHIVATTRAADEEDRRRRPLEKGERIDPNKASEIDLDRLPGVGPATASAIVTARDSGIVFGRPDDLLIVRGIGPSTLERLRPWVDLRGASRGRARASSTAAGGAPPVDLNRADVAELQRLPGIGPALAGRIVEARADRPFASLEDLERVAGIGPATVARLGGLAVVGAKR